MSNADIRVLPLRIDNKVVTSKDSLQEFVLDKRKDVTLLTVYRKYIREKEHDVTFSDFVDGYCDHKHISNPYDIRSMNTKSRDWREVVNEIMTDESIEAVINNVLSIALGDSKNAIKASELIANWMGASQRVEVNADVKGDMNVRVKPDLFQLPND